MTSWQPLTSWTWHGSALGLSIDYHHRFEPIDGERTELTWTVELAEGRAGLRARAFTRAYGRNLDRAWPSFVTWAEGQGTAGGGQPEP